jgi:hypothetical protein
MKSANCGESNGTNSREMFTCARSNDVPGP